MFVTTVDWLQCCKVSLHFDVVQNWDKPSIDRLQSGSHSFGQSRPPLPHCRWHTEQRRWLPSTSPWTWRSRSEPEVERTILLPHRRLPNAHQTKSLSQRPRLSHCFETSSSWLTRPWWTLCADPTVPDFAHLMTVNWAHQHDPGHTGMRSSLRP